mmetsp:Transcript_417/g.953  ORF Transcript_417/g.953 Transcript_417/m.953 type:complete len:283 (-) Transcript_417:364-1212(-)
MGVYIGMPGILAVSGECDRTSAVGTSSSGVCVGESIGLYVGNHDVGAYVLDDGGGDGVYVGPFGIDCIIGDVDVVEGIEGVSVGEVGRADWELNVGDGVAVVGDLVIACRSEGGCVIRRGDGRCVLGTGGGFPQDSSLRLPFPSPLLLLLGGFPQDNHPGDSSALLSSLLPLLFGFPREGGGLFSSPGLHKPKGLSLLLLPSPLLLGGFPPKEGGGLFPCPPGLSSPLLLLLLPLPLPLHHSKALPDFDHLETLPVLEDLDDFVVLEVLLDEWSRPRARAAY